MHTRTHIHTTYGLSWDYTCKPTPHVDTPTRTYTYKHARIHRHTRTHARTHTNTQVHNANIPSSMVESWDIFNCRGYIMYVYTRSQLCSSARSRPSSYRARVRGVATSICIAQGRDLSAGRRSLEAPLRWNRVHRKIKLRKHADFHELSDKSDIFPILVHWEIGMDTTNSIVPINFPIDYNDKLRYKAIDSLAKIKVENLAIGKMHDI